VAADLPHLLLDRLVEKALEDMAPQERLAFIERLFAQLPPDAQQEFLLRLAERLMGGQTPSVAAETREASSPSLSRGRRPPLRHRTRGRGQRGMAPWHVCCRMMDDWVQAPRPGAVTGPIARTFSALADETRLKIIKLLADRPHTVDELVQMLGLAQSTVSHHLRVLREAGVVAGEKRGRNVYYSLTEPLQSDSSGGLAED